jgi:transcriptional regulator with AAA-type ATPase domain
MHVGSVSANEIVLPVSGVSRRHAVVACEEDAVHVRDLQSRNGVTVNGRRTGQAKLRPDDEVRFGPVTLRLEKVEPGDVELALAFSGGVPGATGAGETPGTTASLEMAPLEGEWLALVERVVPSMRAGTASLGHALRSLVKEASLRGACAIEVRPDGAVVLGAAGTVDPFDPARIAELLHVNAGVSAARSGVVPGTPPLVCAALPGRPPRALLAWDESGGRGLESVLRILVHLIPGGDNGPPAAVAGTGAGHRPLVFPSRHVRGDAPAMRELYRRMEAVADTDLPVLILGETGVGKEDVARALHLSSTRAAGPFVAINCAAIPGDLLEAELFGVGKGAATGVNARAGRFQLAHRGTLLLDEIGDMGAPLQAKLLRVLETGEVEPLGSPPQTVDLRVIAATHAELAARVEAGQFRADLYYRLSGDVLRVPPLRERRDDIPALVDGILRPLAVEVGKPIRGVTARALQALLAHSWPGNVRELEHELQRLLHACGPGEAIEFGMLRDEIRRPSPPAALADTGSLDLQRAVDDVEARLIRDALDRSGGNRSAAAKLLGISRNGLSLKMTRLGLDR